MSGISQKEAVFSAVKSLFSQSGRTFTEGTKITLSKEERATVTQMVVEGINSGDVAFSDDAQAKYDTTDKVKGYVSGMVGNWLTKDKRLNGDQKYTPANPGSRAGQGDEVLKNLKALRTTLTDASHITAVDSEIEKRKEAIASSKTPSVAVDFSALPAELLAKLNLNQPATTAE
jgi:hypothetical protein